MLPRVLEPEVMDTSAEAEDYDAMDHREVNQRFADQFLNFLGGGPDRMLILDVGAGTAQIPIEIVRRSPECNVTAIDLAAHMLHIAGRNVHSAGLQDRIALELVDAKQMPYPDASFDAVVSNSIVHHIPEPLAALKEMRRVVKTGGVLFVRDLLRPTDESTVEHLVDLYAAGANDHQRSMFRDSLHAALTLEEVRELIAAVGLPAESATRTTDRHWTVAVRC